MNNILLQLPALLGVLLGALASFLITNAIEKGRWRRSLDARWDEKRIAAYAEYGGCLKKKSYYILRAAAGRVLRVRAKPFPSRKTEAGALTEVEIERSARWELVLLLGSKEAIEAALKYTELVLELGELSEANVVDKNRWDGNVGEMSRARNDFYEAARHDLGIKFEGAHDAFSSWSLVSGSNIRSGR